MGKSICPSSSALCQPMSSRVWTLVLVCSLSLTSLGAQENINSARLAFENGDFETAVRIFEEVKRRGGTTLTDCAMYAISLSEIGRHAAAESVVGELLAESQDQDYAQYAGGIVAFNVGDYGTAVDRFRSAAALRPLNDVYVHALAIALVNHGASCQEKGETEAAGVAYRAALNLDPTDARILSFAAAGLAELGDEAGHRAALRAWNRVDPTNPDAWALLGRALQRAGDAAAVEAFRNAVRLGSEAPEAYLAIARADRDLPMLHLAIGKAIHRAGALELSITQRLESEEGAIDEAALRAASSYAAELTATRAVLEEALALLSEWTPAEELEEVIRMLASWYPHSVELKGALARYYFERGATEEAAELWRDALREAPASVEAHLGLGRCLESQGRLHAAAASYRRALGLDDENREVYAALKQVYRNQGRQEELRSILIDRTYISSWNAVLLEELIALERDLGLTSSADSRMDRLEKVRASHPHD